MDAIPLVTSNTTDINTSAAGPGVQGGFYFPEGMSWAVWTKEILTPVIVFTGIVGNILSFIVMSSRHLRRKGYSFYLRALAIFDSLTLLNREILAVDEIYLSYGKPSIFHNFGDGSCKTIKFVEYVSCLMSSWLVVFMAAERFVAIYFPLRKTPFCSRKRAVVAIFILFFVICCSQIYILLMFEHARGTCSVKPEYRLAYLRLFTYLYLLILILALPTALIVFCNGMVVSKLFRYKHLSQVKNSHSEKEKSTWGAQRRHKTTYMLITITSAYVITILPSTLCTVVIQIAIESKPMMEAYTILMAFEPYKHLLEVWSALNYGINFFIYILSGQMFRRELRRVLTGKEFVNGSVTKTTKSTYAREEMALIKCNSVDHKNHSAYEKNTM